MIREVLNPGKTWDRLMELFHATFPPETRESDEQLLTEIQGHSNLRFRYWAWETDGELAGFIRAVHLPQTNAWFVIHIATASGHRGLGIGRALLSQAAQEASGRPILCEVEPGPPMAWWIRQGARTLSATYTQPALHADTAPVPFHLMAIGRVDDASQVVTGFYREAWDLPSDHPFVLRTLEGLE